jgi:hypothetical protein
MCILDKVDARVTAVNYTDIGSRDELEDLGMASFMILAQQDRLDIDTILYRTPSAHKKMASVSDSVRNIRKLQLIYFITVTGLSVFLACGLVSDGGFGLALGLLISVGLACYSYTQITLLNRVFYLASRHAYLIASTARNLSVDYQIHGFISDMGKGFFLLGYRACSFYLASKEGAVGVLRVSTKSKSENIDIEFTPLNDCIKKVVSKSNNSFPFTLIKLFEIFRESTFHEINFNVEHKDEILAAAIPLNRYVADLTHIENPSLIELWMRTHLPSCIVAKRPSDIDVEVLMHLLDNNEAIYIPTAFHLELAQSYFSNSNTKHAHTFLRWFYAYSEMSCYFNIVRSNIPKTTGWLLKNHNRKVFGLRSRPLLIPDYFQKIIKMAIQRLGLTYEINEVNEELVKGYQALFGTAEALKIFPKESRLLLNQDIGL